MTTSSTIEQAIALNQVYLEEYGVKNSFYRFLDDILPAPILQKLLASMWIDKRAWLNGTPLPMTDAEKRQYLYQLRNAYTHQAEARPGLTIDLPEGLGPVTPPEKTFYFYEQLTKATGFESVSFSMWPQVLIECVRQGLVRHLREYLP